MRFARWLFLFALVITGWFFLREKPAHVPQPHVPEPSSPALKEPVAQREKVADVITPPILNEPTRPQFSAVAVGGPRPHAPTAPTLARREPKKLKDRVLRDEEGLLLRSGQAEAAKACAAQGMRLPTFRELAELAVTRGAMGIIEPGDFQPEQHGSAYSLVKPLNSDGYQDAFYYNPIGYKEPVFQASRAEFWSSSTCVNCVIGGEGGNSAYSMDAETGGARDRYSDVPLGVRCVAEEPAAWLDSDK